MNDTNNVVYYNASGKQNPEIAIDNAIIIANRLLDEAFALNHNALGYALERQLEYLQAAKVTKTETNTD